MPTSHKITLRFVNPNSSSGGVDSYTIYRAVDEDPCPNGTPNTSAQDYYTTTVTPSDGEAAEYIFEDTNVLQFESYFYRALFTRGTKTSITQTALGPCVTFLENDLSFEGSELLDSAALSNYHITSEPLFYFNADKEHKLTRLPVGSEFTNTSNSLHNFTNSYRGWTLKNNTATQFTVLDDWNPDSDFKIIRPEDNSTLAATYLYHQLSVRGDKYYDKWGYMYNNLRTTPQYWDSRVEPLGYDISGKTWPTVHGGTQGNVNNLAQTGYGLNGNIVFDLGYTIHLIYSAASWQIPNQPSNDFGFLGRYDSSGNLDNSVSSSARPRFRQGWPVNFNAVGYRYMRWSTGDPYWIDPSKPDFLPDRFPEFTNQGVIDKVIPTGYWNGSWSTMPAKVEFLNNTFKFHDNISQTAPTTEEAGKFNIITVRVEADQTTSFYLNGSLSPSGKILPSTFTGSFASNGGFDSAQLDLFFSEQHGITTNFAQYGTRFPCGLINSFQLTGRGTEMVIPWSEYMFFPEAVSINDLNILQSYAENKYGAALAAQVDYV
jgi:hypothetical protein